MLALARAASSCAPRIRRKQACNIHSQTKQAEDACVNLIMGLTGILIWPAVVLAAVSAAMDVWGAVTAMKAMKAIQSEMSGGDGGVQFSGAAGVANKA